MCGLKFSKKRRKKKADPNQLSERNFVKMVQTLSMVVCFILSATSSLLVPRTECWCPCPVLSEKNFLFCCCWHVHKYGEEMVGARRSLVLRECIPLRVFVYLLMHSFIYLCIHSFIYFVFVGSEFNIFLASRNPLLFQTQYETLFG